MQVSIFNFIFFWGFLRLQDQGAIGAPATVLDAAICPSGDIGPDWVQQQAALASGDKDVYAKPGI